MDRDFGLTSAFRKANGIEKVYRIDGVPHVDARNALKPEAIRALRYAAGDEVVVIDLSEGAERPVATPPPRKSFATQGDGPSALRDAADSSLADRLVAPFLPARDVERVFRQMARLLEAGHPARSLGLERGRLDLAPSHLVRSDAAADTRGLDLAEWAASVSGIPDWIKFSLASCLDEAGQARAVRAIAGHLERRAVREREVLDRALSSLFLWPALTGLNFIVSIGFGLGAAIFGSIFALRFALLRGNRATSDNVRAEVLRIVAIQLRIGATLGQAIRAAAMRLKDIEPTWGEPPETRVGLGRMLRLDEVDTIVLMSGDPTPACLRLAREFERQDRACLDRTSILARMAIGLLAGATVIGLLV